MPEEITDKQLRSLKVQLEKGAVGISTDVIWSLIARIELQPNLFCGVCRQTESECECEVYSAVKWE